MADNALEATVTCGVRWTYCKSDDIGTAQDAGGAAQTTEYATGIGPNSGNVIYRDRILLTLGQWIWDVDLLAALDIYSDTLAMTKVKGFFFQNLGSAVGDDIFVGALGAPNPLIAPWGGEVWGHNVLGPQGILVLNNPVDGFTVSATAKTIRIRHAGVTYPIYVDFAILGTKPL